MQAINLNSVSRKTVNMMSQYYNIRGSCVLKPEKMVLLHDIIGNSLTHLVVHGSFAGLLLLVNMWHDLHVEKFKQSLVRHPWWTHSSDSPMA